VIWHRLADENCPSTTSKHFCGSCRRIWPWSESQIKTTQQLTLKQDSDKNSSTIDLEARVRSWQLNNCPWSESQIKRTQQLTLKQESDKNSSTIDFEASVRSRQLNSWPWRECQIKSTQQLCRDTKHKFSINWHLRIILLQSLNELLVTINKPNPSFQITLDSLFRIFSSLRRRKLYDWEGILQWRSVPRCKIFDYFAASKESWLEHITRHWGPLRRRTLHFSITSYHKMENKRTSDARATLVTPLIL
jgi:hypothetical protein